MKKYMLDKIKEANFKRIDNLATIIANKNNVKKSFVKRDMIKNFIKYGIGYTDYFKGDYINRTEEEKKTFLTAKNYVPILNYLNKKSYRVVTNDKVVFLRIFNKYAGRDWIDLRVTSDADFKKFLQKYKTVFAKVKDDFGGHGIRKIEDKGVKDYKKLYKELKENGNILIEEEIKQHKVLEKMNPYAVNALRVVSLLKDGEVHILRNALRININDEVAITCADAFASVTIDGKLETDIADDAGNYYKEHPLTKVKFKDLTIPYVKECFELVKEAHKLIPDIRYVGWDIVITPTGPIILEGNEYPSYGLVQYYMVNKSKYGHLKDIKDVLKDEWNNIKF